ncbi:hypothetical protein A4G99_07420 [Haladaptatus sp. R4]|uniref:CPBP family intramembrane glutamic endopeptidase n=1 Tax=Haladaptatus sp. R4 TaxID=1679489 RepID=UPI0007B4B665|nr:type II CAAX endopeptidase family protein [Haladaptatus sp. R4]KZN24250.1 hypothetical protein A4G99_07420 [Haladaptatus sp. R4]
MVTPNWNAFAGVTLTVLVVLIALARASQAMFVGEDEDGWEESETSVETPDRRVRNGGDEWGKDERSRNGDEGDDDERDTNESNDSTFEDQDHRPTEVSSPIPDEPFPAVESPTPVEDFTPGTLLVNVALSQGLFGVILVVAAVLTAIPADTLGVRSVTATQFGVGALLGVALYVANELGQRVVDAVGIEYEDSLREMLTPDSVRGWVVLLVLVLPIIAGFEELLFRSSLVGVFAAGYGISPWFLVVASSVAFAVGHGAQGPAGVLVTGTLGAALAGAFVLTESMVVVVVAHYLVNALEFAVHARDDSTE